MPIKRVALIFDDQTRPETTGVYCRRALADLTEVEHFSPSNLAQIPRQGFDLYLCIDDGLEYELPADLRPAAWWAIDTHLNFDWCLKKARTVDCIFAAQRDGAERLRQEGIESARWLPLACDPEVHRKHDLPKKYDVGFVGNIFPGPRAELLDLVQERFSNTFVGRCYFEEMAKTYSACRMTFNRSIRNDINMRVFEAVACGSLLLTNELRANGQEELFRDGVHLVTYESGEELLEKIDFYLRREKARERIAAAGRKEALVRHTYRHRMGSLLAEVAKDLTKSRGRVKATRGMLSRPSKVSKKDSDRKGRESMAPTAPTAPIAPMATTALETAARDPSYFEFARPELLTLISTSAHRVLDIGCGAGRLGEAIKARQDAEVVGIEFVPQVGRLAEDRLDRVIVGDVEQVEPDFAPGMFDVIVCGDVLEHLRDPVRLLRRARQWLAPEGELVASIPNVRHHSVVRSLLEGNWTYESAGLLDRDHIRFFTRREIEKLFFRAGFAIEEMQLASGPGDEELLEQARNGEVKVGRLHIGGMASGDAEEFYVYQYLIKARPIGPDTDHGLTSIVILTHNQVDYTRQCLDSIRQHTDEPHEVIVVDNASTDATVAYLGSLADVQLIANKQNRGFPAAANQGIRAATGKQVLLLNNDTLVTTGWLLRMLRALHSDSKVGLVGPCSNCVSGEQQVEASYDDLAGLDGFAWDWGKAQNRQMADTDRLVGFCLLIRRELIDKIGLLDERFGLGCFEDDDYCRRALGAGYRAVIAQDAFVHHFGSRTFAGSGVDFAAQMRKNQELYHKKWRQDRRREQRTSSKPSKRRKEDATSGELSVHPGNNGGLVLVRDRVELSLCMIVRDNADTIAAALSSIKPWVDEMVVVDTGSRDDTPDIAQGLGARVFHFPWCEDFSAARNESLRHARGQWVFWMDSDDTIDAPNGRKLRELVRRRPDPSLLGYVMQVHCPGAGLDGEADLTVVDHVKLFRNLPRLRFDGRIHEQILPAIRQAGGEVAFTDVFVVHSGYDHSSEGQEKKKDRDFRLLRLELAERPNHPFTLFNLGMTCADVGQFQEAVDYLKRSIEQSGQGDSHLRKAYALLVYAQGKLEQGEAAWATCQKGLALFPDDPELCFRRGILLQERGQLNEAVKAYESVLHNRAERHFSSLDRGIHGYKAHQNLAVVYTEMGNLVEAEKQWRLVLDEMPRYRSGWRGLGEVLLQQEKEQEVVALTEQLVSDSGLAGAGFALKGLLAASRGDKEEARSNFKRAVAADPKDLDVQHTFCHFLFEQGGPAEAEVALRELVQLDPLNAAVHHNLGTVCMRLRQYSRAAHAYRESVGLRPNSAGTYFQLGNALKEIGRRKEAVAAWQQVLRLSPGDRSAQEAIEQAQVKTKKKKKPVLR